MNLAITNLTIRYVNLCVDVKWLWKFDNSTITADITKLISVAKTAINMLTQWFQTHISVSLV